ncbi:hypothetical protein B0H14DRAFT_2862312, partial [Mycena olivaceomarginata]
MKSYFALLIFVQLAASWVAASPVAREFVIFVKYPGEETSDKVQRSPAIEPNNAQRSPLGDVPLIHYPGGNTENHKNLPKARASLLSPNHAAAIPPTPAASRSSTILKKG